MAVSGIEAVGHFQTASWNGKYTGCLVRDSEEVLCYLQVCMYMTVYVGHSDGEDMERKWKQSHYIMLSCAVHLYQHQENVFVYLLWNNGLKMAENLLLSVWQASTLRAFAYLSQELEKGLKRVEKAQEDAKRSEMQKLLESLKDPSADPTKRTSLPHNEKPIVRVAIKHLMAGLKKHAPAEGFIASMLKGLMNADVYKRNYLQSLYDHVKTLACMVEDCQGNSRGRHLIHNCYFFNIEWCVWCEKSKHGCLPKWQICETLVPCHTIVIWTNFMNENSLWK